MKLNFLANRGKMVNGSGLCLVLMLLLMTSIAQFSLSDQNDESGLKTQIFLSPEFVLEPGLVSDKYSFNIDFPRGHIAIKGFTGEVVDETGSSIPLHETYLHHWLLFRYYGHKGMDSPNFDGDLGSLRSEFIMVKNRGMCESGLTQYFGVGAETRRTATDVPDPYGIEVGNPSETPAGYEERWLLNVHAIDTRGAVDKLGCTECRCNLYNVSTGGDDNVLSPSYIGGLRCCNDGMRCRVKHSYQGVKRSLYFRYTVKYMHWDASISPVEIYVLDVTDKGAEVEESKGVAARHKCLIEYDIVQCPVLDPKRGCTHSKTLTINLPTGGDIIYAAGHQHTGGIGITLYGQGGRVLCSSNPIYGNGLEAGNEDGYIVGMSTCYPSPGAAKISAGETLTIVSNYSSLHKHTGVMGVFTMHIAPSFANQSAVLNAPLKVAHKTTTIADISWAIALLGVALAIVLAFSVYGRTRVEEGYEAVP